MGENLTMSQLRTTSDETKIKHKAEVLAPGSFEPERHFYQRALNAQIHPIVAYFLGLSTKRIIQRYCHLHPSVDKAELEAVINYKPNFFRWAGADLFNSTTQEGHRQMVVIETNSCPSGQKSMPLLDPDNGEFGGYISLISRTVKPFLEEQKALGKLIEGRLAVVYDKNKMEASGYAATIAEVFEEECILVEWYSNDDNPAVRFTEDRILQVYHNNEWQNIRAAFRYVTQKPWTRIPVYDTKTFIINPIVACLAGGRNKALAAKAYDFFNAELSRKHSGLAVKMPETIRDVTRSEIPIYVDRFGGHAVVKIPYSNAGQGVYTITNQQELDEFMAETENTQYDNYFVQACYRPLVIYARRARVPLGKTLDGSVSSWDMLGTNLSVKLPDGKWDTETNRLVLMDRKDFNTLGIAVDDLIDAYIQTVLASVAIDSMATKLVTPEGFEKNLFSGLNKDDGLLSELLI